MQRILELADAGDPGFDVAQAFGNFAGVGEPEEIDEPEAAIRGADRAQDAAEGVLEIRLIAGGRVGAGGAGNVGPDLPEEGLQVAHQQGAQLGRELDVEDFAARFDLGLREDGKAPAEQRLRLREAAADEARRLGILQVERRGHAHRSGPTSG
jgi:hypothetical protein